MLKSISKKINESYSLSDILYPGQSFLSGFTRILDLRGFNQSYNTSKTEREADYNALYSDWSTVGFDIMTSIHSYSIDSET